MAGRWTRRPTTDEQAIAACKRANAHDFVEKLPEGYQTQIQRSGGSLSGGLGAAVGEPAILLHAPLHVSPFAGASPSMIVTHMHRSMQFSISLSGCKILRADFPHAYKLRYLQVLYVDSIGNICR